MTEGFGPLLLGVYMLYWKAYVEALLGITVEDAQEKFDALADAERAAWNAGAAVKVTGE